MVRLVVCLALATSACVPSQVPAARRTGMTLSLVGVVGLIASAAASGAVDTRDLVVGFSAVSGIGICTFAVADLSDPPRAIPPETENQKLRRWARTLTARAGGAAREGKCDHVRRLEERVRLYDPETHDFVFMRDPEIQRCYAITPAAAPTASAADDPD